MPNRIIKPKQATIQHVAKEAGLSPTAVSRYLNGKLDLPELTRERISSAIKKLHYRPSTVARRLRTQRSETLGFVTADISYPFPSSVAFAAEAEADKHGYTLAIFCSRNQIDRELEILSKLEDGQLDGILLMTNHQNTKALAEKINGLGPVVLIDEDVPGANASRVFAENYEGSYAATQHLLQHGHRNIVFLGGLEKMVSTIERRAGFEAAHRDAKAQPNRTAMFFGPYGEAFGRACFEKVNAMVPRPTAVLATAESFAVGFLRSAREAHVRVPDDISLVTFQDTSYADMLMPPLTAILQPTDTFGQRGIELLIHNINSKTYDVEPSRVPVSLVDRGSVRRI